MDEIWKPVVGYEGYYEVSNFGRVKSLDRYIYNEGVLGDNKYVLIHGELLTKHNPGSNHYTVGICRDGKSKNRYIHRLVAEAFIDNPNNLPMINHKDEDPSNNCVENLEWCTPIYNTNYGTCVERRSEKIKTPIVQYTKDGDIIREWSSASDAARAMNADSSFISSCVSHNRKTAYGFLWRCVGDEDISYIDVQKKAVYCTKGDDIRAFESRVACAKYFGVSDTTVKNKCRNHALLKGYMVSEK